MAKNKKTGGRDFSKGVSGNPGGRPKLSVIEKEARELARVQIATGWIKVSQMPYQYILLLTKEEKNLTDEEKKKKEKLKKKLNLFELFLMGLFSQSTKRGEMHNLDLYLNRLLGKSLAGASIPGDKDSDLRDISDQELDEELSRLEEILSGTK